MSECSERATIQSPIGPSGLRKASSGTARPRSAASRPVKPSVMSFEWQRATSAKPRAPWSRRRQIHIYLLAAKKPVITCRLEGYSVLGQRTAPSES